MIKITGIKALEQMSEQFQKLGGEIEDVAEASGLEIADDVVRDQFNTGTDPYGQKWKPLSPGYLKWKKTRPGVGVKKIGVLTGAMAGSLNSKASGASFTISFGQSYATYFNGARPLLPDKGLPATWIEVIEDNFGSQIDEILG
jgi:hypothetical protein